MTDFIKGWLIGAVTTAVGAAFAAFVIGAAEHCAAPSAAERVADLQALLAAEAAQQ